MENMMRLLSKLVERRSGNGAGVFVAGAILTSLLWLWCLADLGAPAIMILWCVVPLALFAIQIARPTILGWSLLTLPWCLYTLTGYSYMVRDLSEGLTSGFIPGLIVMGVFTALSYSLVRCFPKKCPGPSVLAETNPRETGGQGE